MIAEIQTKNYKNEQIVVKTFDLKIAQNRYDFEVIKTYNFLFNSMHCYELA